MGSYGIGPSRLAAAIIEASHDDAGIIWPDPVAPFDVMVLDLKAGDGATGEACRRLEQALATRGLDVLVDDRDERPGAKFATADLIGIPWQILVGPKGLAAGKVELKRRATGERELLTIRTRWAGRRVRVMRPTVLPGRTSAHERHHERHDELAATRRGLAPVPVDAGAPLSAGQRRRLHLGHRSFPSSSIMLSVATLIIVLSVMNGFQGAADKIVGVNGHVFVQPIDAPLTDYADVSARLAKLDGVTLVVPMVEGQALASSPFAANGVLVRGVREEDIKRIPFIAGNLRQGTLEGFDDKVGVAIGRRLAESLSLRVGDTLSLVAPRGATTPAAPRIKAYPIVAIFEIGMSEFDAAFLYMPLGEAQAYFNRDGDVNVIEVFLANADKVDQARRLIDEAAGRPLAMTDWRQRNRTFFSALEVERNVMFLILTLIVLVAALNIVSGLIMLVKDKSADIAILRTMGATRGAIMRVFLITGAAIGVVGTLAGFVLGLLITLTWDRSGNSVATPAQPVPGRVFPQPPSGCHRSGRGSHRRAHGHGAVPRRHALSELPRGAARSRRSLALWLRQR
jgi:lipoprotein-releasing system permease protein